MPPAPRPARTTVHTGNSIAKDLMKFSLTQPTRPLLTQLSPFVTKLVKPSRFRIPAYHPTRLRQSEKAGSTASMTGLVKKHLQAYLNECTIQFNRRFYPFNAIGTLVGITGGTATPTSRKLYTRE
jgi:hypothetical protein